MYNYRSFNNCFWRHPWKLVMFTVYINRALCILSLTLLVIIFLINEILPILFRFLSNFIMIVANVQRNTTDAHCNACPSWSNPWEIKIAIMQKSPIIELRRGDPTSSSFVIIPKVAKHDHLSLKGNESSQKIAKDCKSMQLKSCKHVSKGG